MKPNKNALKLIMLLLAFCITLPVFIAVANPEDEFTDTFPLDRCHFVTAGKNCYFPLKPGCFWYLEGEDDEEFVQLLICVTHRTKVVNGVKTRIVREIEWADGELVEISCNYFALCKCCNYLFYFGEDVNIYENGEVSHEGAWLAGKDGARAGLMMPCIPLLGSRYFQEIAPDVAMDRAEHISLTETVDTPAGIFENCLMVEETTPIEPDALDYKFYKCGVGIVQDGPLKLVCYGCW